MTPTADATISALRSTHDELAAVVRDLDDEQLLAPSGASEWPVAQVLSHLGSGAEIGLATLRAATGAGEALGRRLQPVGLGPLERDVPARAGRRLPRLRRRRGRRGVRGADARSSAPTSRSPSASSRRRCPSPRYAGMRLNEAAQHSWDVRVAFDDDAAIDETTASLLVDHLADGLGFMLGFTGKADQVQRARPRHARRPRPRALGHRRGLARRRPTVAAAATATLVGPADAVARLISGRLTPRWTPDAVSVTGNVDLDDLRRVFPGY